jgi:hypothetical protein
MYHFPLRAFLVYPPIPQPYAPPYAPTDETPVDIVHVTSLAAPPFTYALAITTSPQ